MTPDETAKKFLSEQMAPSQVKFSEFRAHMIEEHPDYLDDDTIHDLYLKHVLKQNDGPVFETPLSQVRPAEELFGPLDMEEMRKRKAVDQAMAFTERQEQERKAPRSRRKSLLDKTIAEVLGDFKRALKNINFGPRR